MTEIETKSKKIIDILYKAYGTDSGVLFGISDRDAVGAIIKFAVERTTIHMCNDCKYHFATCHTSDIAFGEGIGNDNVIRCIGFKEKS